MSHETLLRHLEDCSERSRVEALSFSAVFHELGRDGLPMALVLLCLPFLQPLTLGPLASVGGLVIAGVGWQMARGRTELWLPVKIGKARMNQEHWRKLLGVLRWLVALLAKVTRRRLTGLTDGDRGQRIAGWLAVVGGLLLAVPLAGVPFNNLFPALMVVSAAAAVLERDGLLYGAALVWCVVSLAYFALVGYLVFIVGAETSAWMQAHVPWWPG